MGALDGGLSYFQPARYGGLFGGLFFTVLLPNIQWLIGLNLGKISLFSIIGNHQIIYYLLVFALSSIFIYTAFFINKKEKNTNKKWIVAGVLLAVLNSIVFLSATTNRPIGASTSYPYIADLLTSTTNNNYFAKIGIEYQTVKSWSYSNNEYKYDSKGEYTSSNGDILNMLTIPLPSPIGEMSTQNILRRSANITINDGDKLEINMESHQKYQFINIPIGLGLSKKINNNHIINIGVDFNLSYLLQLKNTFDASMFHNGEKMEMMKSTIVDIQKINKYIYGISGQVAYQYRFNERFFWNLSFSYLRSINSIYSTKFSSTKIHGIHFNTGISLKF